MSANSHLEGNGLRLFRSTGAESIKRISLPLTSMATHLEEMGRFSEWCLSFGLRIAGTRFDRYVKYMIWRANSDDDLDVGIFLDGDDSPIKSGVDRYLYVLREVHEICWISEGLRGKNIPGISSLLEKIIGGADFAALDKNSLSRNTQFELRIASYLSRAGYKIKLDGITDIVAARGGRTFHIECKRVASEKQLEARVKEAGKQISARLPRGVAGRHYGIVALDVTKVAYPHNGLVVTSSPDVAREGIQEKLKKIGNEIERGKYLEKGSAIATWVQIHIPVMSVRPPVPQARFSTYFMPNWNSNFKHGKVIDKFCSDISRVMKRANREVDEIRDFVPRRGMTIPAGTHFSPDDVFVDALRNGEGFSRFHDDRVILSVLPPGGGEDDWIDFYLFEFRSIWDGLLPERRADLSGSREHVLSVLLGLLLSTRFPFLEDEAWLDSPSPKIDVSDILRRLLGSGSL